MSTNRTNSQQSGWVGGLEIGTALKHKTTARLITSNTNPIANGSILVFPTIIIPWSINLWTTEAVYGGMKLSSIREPHDVLIPFVQKLSFTAIGIPYSGPWYILLSAVKRIARKYKGLAFIAINAIHCNSCSIPSNSDAWDLASFQHSCVNALMHLNFCATKWEVSMSSSRERLLERTSAHIRAVDTGEICTQVKRWTSIFTLQEHGRWSVEAKTCQLQLDFQRRIHTCPLLSIGE